MDRAGLEARLPEVAATGRTLSGGHLRVGRADPGNGMLLPPLFGPFDLEVKIVY